MSLYNVKQYNFNMNTCSTDMHFVANAKSLAEAKDIMMGAMNVFSDKGWFIKRCDDKLLEVVKGHERIKVVVQEIR